METFYFRQKKFEIPPFFQTRPGDLGKKVHACSLRFSALNFQAFWVKPSPTLGLVYQVKKADWYPFVPFVSVCLYSVHSICKSVLPISTSKTSEQG